VRNFPGALLLELVWQSLELGFYSFGKSVREEEESGLFGSLICEEYFPYNFSAHSGILVG
jgi:hypothetical protein